MIPQSFIDDLLFRVDIVDVVGRYVQLKPAGLNLQGLCPFHNEKSPSFTVSATKQFYHCFGCGVHGNALGFVMEHLGLSFPEAVESLAGNMGIEVPHEKGVELPAEVVSEREQMFDLMAKASNYYKGELKKDKRAVDYLKQRGLTGVIAAKYGMGYSPDDYQNLIHVVPDYDSKPMLDDIGLTKLSENGRRYDRFRDRIMFPIRNGKGQVIGFGGRVLDKGEPKYLNSPETPLFSKGQEVYGLFEGRQAIHRMGYVLITEGYMDVVALAQWGFENAVATLGTAVTAEHVQKLFKQTRRLVFSFDGDKAGRKAAWRALEACLPHVTEEKIATFVFLPPEHDPDSFIRTEGAEAFEFEVTKALGLSQFLMQHLQNNYQIGQVEGNSSAMAFLKPLISQIPASTYRVEMVRQLADMLGQTPVQLASQLGLSARRASESQFYAGEPGRKNAEGGRAGGRVGGGGPSGWVPGGNYQKGGGNTNSKWAKKDPYAGTLMSSIRPQAKSPLMALAARLLKAPDQIAVLDPLVHLLERDQNPVAEIHSFLHFVDKVRTTPERIEAVMHNAFNDQVHQVWADTVLKEAHQLGHSLPDLTETSNNFETELRDSVYHCSEWWYKAELDRLAGLMPLEGPELAWYHSCMQQFQELKQKRIETKPS
ncbi:MAG: DNA primase [Limnobacter sp.]|nr:DNA primase [Limnobacter sp.]